MRIYYKPNSNSESLCNEDWQCMQAYIKQYGWHFNEAMCKYAISMMIKNGKPLQCLSKDEVDVLLASNKIILMKNKQWDYVFVANMGKADYLGSSIPDDKHLALYIKDTIDDEDADSGTIFRRWCATMTANNKLIDWTNAK